MVGSVVESVVVERGVIQYDWRSRCWRFMLLAGGVERTGVVEGSEKEELPALLGTVAAQAGVEVPLARWRERKLPGERGFVLPALRS